MCGTPMAEVRATHLRGQASQGWQCPRCLHANRDRYDDHLGEGEDDAGPTEGH